MEDNKSNLPPTPPLSHDDGEDNDGAYGNDDKDITGGKEVHGGDTPSDDH